MWCLHAVASPYAHCWYGGHDWDVAGEHKLILSVYAGFIIKGNTITYSGSTAFFIRNGKHDPSTAATHAANLVHLDSFEDIMFTVIRIG